MKQLKIINAYKATEVLANNTSLSNDIQWSIYRLRKALTPHIEFYKEREQAIKDKYSMFIDDKGYISGEEASKFQNEIQELNNMDKDIDFEPCEIQVPEGNGITALIMEQLEGFIQFTK